MCFELVRKISCTGGGSGGTTAAVHTAVSICISPLRDHGHELAFVGINSFLAIIWSTRQISPPTINSGKAGDAEHRPSIRTESVQWPLRLIRVRDYTWSSTNISSTVVVYCTM